MTSLTHRILGLCLLSVLSTPAAATICAADQTPAATLLFPRAEVDLSTDSEGVTTVLEIRNQSPNPHLANVTLWSDHGVPVFAFPVYFGGFDTVSTNLRALLLDGETPLTGPEQLAEDALSNPNTTFPNCGTASPPSTNALSPTTAQELREALLGGPSDLLGGNCATQDVGTDFADLFVTVDHVTECGVGHPGESSYYQGELGFANVFTGSWRFVDPLNNFSYGQPAVHIEAAGATFFSSGDATFYGKFAGDPSDRREPLPTAFSLAVPPSDDDFGGTFAVTWREPKSSAVGGFACGTGGFGLRLGFSGTLNDATGQDDPFVALNEGGGVVASGSNLQNFVEPDIPVDLMFNQRIDDLFSGDAGRFVMNLQADDDSPATFGQAWAMTVQDSAGRFAEVVPAIPLDDNCPTGGATTVIRSGPSTTDRAGSPIFHSSMEPPVRWSEL